MKPTIYVMGPQGCGKTRLILALDRFQQSEICPAEFRGLLIVEVQTAGGVLQGVTLEDIARRTSHREAALRAEVARLKEDQQTVWSDGFIAGEQSEADVAALRAEHPPEKKP